MVGLYVSLVQSRLLYCTQVWHPHLMKDILNIERVQRHAIKYILNDYISSYKTRLTKLKLSPLMYLFELHDTVYCKSFEVEKFRGFCWSIVKHETFTVKHLSLAFKMTGHSPRCFLKEFLWITFCLGEGFWNNAAFPGLLIHGSNAPNKINITIQLFPNDM